MKKCKVCGMEFEEYYGNDRDDCIHCNNWYFLLYYKYAIYPWLSMGEAQSWHDFC